MLARHGVGLANGQISRGMSFRTISSITRDLVPWTRNGTVATVTLNNHILAVAETITVTNSTSTAAITNSTKTVEAVGDGSFTFTCDNAGETSGTISITQTATPNLYAHIDPGTVHCSGIFHDFIGGYIEITGVGYETIGMLFEAKTVTENDDPSLNDPAIGQDPGYNLPGAYRTVYNLSLTLNDPNSVPIYKLKDGVVIVPPKVDPFEPIYAILARRTNDESGSYMVWGLNGTFSANSSSLFNLNLSSGKAYVEGWEYLKPSTTVLAVDRPLDSDEVPDETHTYHTGTNTYALNMTPVKSVTGIQVTISRTTTLTRGGSPGGADTILDPGYGSVVGGSVSGVSYSGNNYTSPTHYTVSGNLISWAPGGTGVTEEPPTGATYNITYDFIRDLVPVTDFTGSSTGFTIIAAEKPKNNSIMYCTYEPYLERYDLVVMNSKGEISIVKGTPDFYLASEHFATYPKQPRGTLLIGTLYLPPNGAYTACTFTSSNQYRKTMQDMVAVANRVSNLEYNAAVTDLENSAFNIGLATTKKSIFTDNFADWSKMDLEHNVLEANPPAIDFDYTLVPGSTTSWHFLGGAGRWILPSTAVLTLSQLNATESQLVNPYAMFDSATSLVLNPPDDITINNNIIRQSTFEYTPHTSAIAAKWWEEFRAPNSIWTLVDSHGVYALYRSQTSRTIETKILGESNARTVAVIGDGFIPNSDSLRLTFEGTPLDLTATGATEVGTPVDGKTTVKSNASGQFTATFNVAAGIIGGDKHVRIYNANNSGEAIYSIGAINRTIEETVRVRQIDPVAQTFLLAESQQIAAVDIYFTQKDPTLPVRVSIQNVVNGFPGQMVLAEKLVFPGSITTSATGAIATRVTFDYPAFCTNTQEYCVVIASTSNAYQIAIARLGHTDWLTGQVINKNPFAGVMFTSSNATSWSPDQTADIKFALYRTAYTTTTETHTYTAITGLTASFFCLRASSVIPAGCSVVWQYKVNTMPWRTFTPGVTVNSTVAITSLQFRVTLNGTSYQSPIVGGSPVVLVGKYNQTSRYISRNTDLAALGQSAYTGLNIYLDQKLVGSGSSIAVYYAKDGTGTTWISAGAATLVTALADGFSQFKYSVSGITGSPTDMRLRIDLTSSSDGLSWAEVRRAMMIST